ncbi:Uncharacterized iron-regulated membrane protein [bacterium A37T11]|nr:Uncharacterized iron-regulated membrane protein [bacterium A37T11]
MKRWATHQKRWFAKWHLYLGILAGAIVAVVGVTGSILVFQDEIDRALNPHLLTLKQVPEKKQPLPLDELLDTFRREHPSTKIDYLLMENDRPDASFVIYDYSKDVAHFIDPYTGKLLGSRSFKSGFIAVVTSIHTSLLIPVAGQYLVGISALILLILTISGLRLWIPKKWSQLKQVLTVNFKASAKRQNYDWHNSLGFYSSPVVAVLSLTGFCITFSLLVIPILFMMGGKSPQGVQQLLAAKSVYKAGQTPIPIDSLQHILHNHFPADSRIAGIAFPADSTGNYRLDILSTGLPQSGKRGMLLIDQYNGKVLTNSRNDFMQAGNAYLSWLTPLHYGTFGGMPTRILALLGGLIPLVLFITGFVIWWPRYKKNKRNNGKHKKNKVRIENLPAGKAAYFKMQVRRGFIYAFWLLVLSAACGAIYGLPSGLLIRPAAFSILFITPLVLINLVIALLVMVGQLIFLAPFRGINLTLVRYFSWSMPIALVFVAVYYVLASLVLF